MTLKDSQRGMGEGQSPAADRHGEGRVGAAHPAGWAARRVGASSLPVPAAGPRRAGVALRAGVEDACEENECKWASTTLGGASPLPAC